MPSKKPILVVTGEESVVRATLKLAEKFRILPLDPQAWSGYQDRIEIVMPKVPGEIGLAQALRQTANIFRMPLPEGMDRDRTASLYFTHARQLCGILEVLQLLYQEMRVAGVIVHNDVEPVTRAACAWAVAHDVPAIHVPHAHYFQVWRDAPGWDVHDSLTAPNIAAINQVQADWYEGLGAQNVQVTGCPRWDSWVKPFATPEKCRKLLGFEKDRPIAMYMASWAQATSLFGLHGMGEVAFEAYATALKSLGWQNLLMLHYHAAQEINDAFVAKAKEVGLEGKAMVQNFELALRAADIVTAFGPSNALIEATILGKPVLCVGVNAPPIPSVPPDPDAIGLMLTHLIQKGPSEDVLELAPYVGEATQRVADFILECVDYATGEESSNPNLD